MNSTIHYYNNYMRMGVFYWELELHSQNQYGPFIWELHEWCSFCQNTSGPFGQQCHFAKWTWQVSHFKQNTFSQGRFGN